MKCDNCKYEILPGDAHKEAIPLGRGKIKIQCTMLNGDHKVCTYHRPEKKWQHRPKNHNGKRYFFGKWEDCVNKGCETTAPCGDHHCGDSAAFGHPLPHRMVNK